MSLNTAFVRTYFWIFYNFLVLKDVFDDLKSYVVNIFITIPTFFLYILKSKTLDHNCVPLSRFLYFLTNWLSKIIKYNF